MVERLIILLRAMWWSMVSNALLRSRATVTVRSGFFFVKSCCYYIVEGVKSSAG